MVSTGTRIEASGSGGGTQNLSAGVRKTIQSIKEIVGNHSDADIYVALKETNMDPNETAQKLLNQDPFHEVRRKRDKKKEVVGHGSSTASEPRKHYEQVGQGNTASEPRKHYEQIGQGNTASEPRKHYEQVGQGNTTSEPRKHYEQVGQGMKFNPYPDRSTRRSGYGRNASTGVSREFRVVRDNRLNHNREIKPAASSTSTSEPVISNVPVKSSTGTYSNQKPLIGGQSSQDFNGPSDSQPRQSRDGNAVGTSGKNLLEEKLSSVPNAANRMQIVKTHDSHSHSLTSSNNSVIGVYSSSLDPVHVPSRDSRPAANVGAIKREVGVVGARRQSSVSAKLSSSQSGSVNHSNHSQNLTPESAVPAPSVGKSFLSNHQYSSRPHQSVGHQKAPQPSKEWKPKSSQKAAVNIVGVIGMPAKSASPSADNSKDLETEASKLQDKLSQVNISENQNVIIAAHIRVSETDRCRLTFGSLGAEVENGNLGFQAVGAADELNTEPSGSVSLSAPESSCGEPAIGKQLDSTDDRIRNSGSNSPASLPVSEHQPSERKESSSPQNLENYADIGLVQDNNLAYAASEPQQLQDTSELPSFQAYDSQTGYEMPYFRPAIDETVRGQGLPSPHEVLMSHTESTIPVSTIALGQQQQALAQMYPQLHVSHFANLMPYRQFLSPVYVPPMAMPGYSNNPAYAHPTNGSSYLLMPGGSSHLSAGSVKYGMQQFKPVPAGTPTGFGNFTSPTGYAINSPGVVGSATGLEETSRLKYKDGNLYVPNPQAETSEIWMNPRDMPSMQSPSYYNMPGQTPHAAAYLPSHSGHASFNAAAAAAQSSHMQFPGLYHPSQPAAIASPHHLGAAMGGNVGLAAASPGAQLGAYQQPQLGHLNWTGNF